MLLPAPCAPGARRARRVSVGGYPLRRGADDGIYCSKGPATGRRNAPRHRTLLDFAAGSTLYSGQRADGIRGSPDRRTAMASKVDQAVKTAPMTTSEAGRKGGTAVRDKYGEDYYRRIGKLGGTTLKEKRGSDYYRDIAKKGGRANVAKYGPDHFAEMGKKGGNTTKERQSSDFYSRIGRMGGAARRGKKSGAGES